MPNPVTWFEIIGKDEKKLTEFYKTVFSWQVESMPMGEDGATYNMITPQDGKGTGGAIGRADPGRPGHVAIYIEVDDTDAYLKRAEAAGGKTVVPTTVIPGMVTFAMFTDPEGHLVGLHKPMS